MVTPVVVVVAFDVVKRSQPCEERYIFYIYIYIFKIKVCTYLFTQDTGK